MAKTLDPYTLLDLVGELVRIVDEDRPERVSERRFDVEAAKRERYAILPRARNISRILQQGWHSLVELSLREPEERARALSQRMRADQASWLTHEQAEFALRLVCRRLGEIPALSPGEYRREREKLIAAAGGAGDEVREALPSENQIIALFRNWKAALASAGISVSGRKVPEHRIIRGTDVIEVLDRCYEHYGTQPTLSELQLFAQANKIVFPRIERGRGYPDYVREWKERRRAAGLDVPDRPPPMRDRPDYGVDVGAATEEERGKRRRKDISDDEIASWVDLFLDSLRPGVAPTQRVYDDWTHETPGAPNFATLGEHGGFTNLITAGRERRLRRHAA